MQVFFEDFTDPDSEAPEQLFRTLFSQDLQAVEKGLIQVIYGSEAMILVVFKTRLLIWSGSLKDS
jgi:hypothetical protein